MIERLVALGDVPCIYTFLVFAVVYSVGRVVRRGTLEPDLSLFAVAGGISSAWAALLVIAAATKQIPWAETEKKAYTITASVTLMLLYATHRALESTIKQYKSANSGND